MIRTISLSVFVLFFSNSFSQTPTLVYDIKPGSVGSFPGEKIEFNGKLYFSADDGVHGSELWEWDGMNDPVMVSDINIGANSSNPRGFIIYENELLFSANDGISGTEMWSYDGNNTPAIVADINPGIESGFFTGSVMFNNKIYFRASDGAHGTELWVYDSGTNPYMLTDFSLGSANTSIGDLVVYNNTLIMSLGNEQNGWDMELWQSDGVNPPTQLYDLNSSASSTPKELTIIDGLLYFTAIGENEGEELWMYDGTNPPSVVADILPGTIGSAPYDLTEFNGKLLFMADDGVNGKELWEYDPVTGTASMPGETYPGIGSANSNTIDPIFCKMNGFLFFPANGVDIGNELWAYDGINPPFLVINFAYSTESSHPSYLTNFNNKLVYSAQASSHVSVGKELYQLQYMAHLNEHKTIEFRVFPNPASEDLNININGDDLGNELNIELKDLNGRLLKIQRNNNVATSIDVSDISSGIYLLSVNGNSQRIVIK